MTDPLPPPESGPQARGVAIFDFDRTLIRESSLFQFLRVLAGDAALARAALAAAARAVASAEKEAFKRDLLRRLLAGISLAEVQSAAARMFPRLAWKDDILAACERHRRAGCRILIATGGLDCYMPALLAMKGMAADGLLATRMAVEDGVLTGAMASPTCTKAEKARRVASWLENGHGEVWGYGNLPSDAAMLALCDHPMAVPKR
jgi:phosphatidylglycerophosphatase C